jgi:hypothetical protein
VLVGTAEVDVVGAGGRTDVVVEVDGCPGGGGLSGGPGIVVVASGGCVPGVDSVVLVVRGTVDGTGAGTGVTGTNTGRGTGVGRTAR